MAGYYLNFCLLQDIPEQKQIWLDSPATIKRWNMPIRANENINIGKRPYLESR